MTVKTGDNKYRVRFRRVTQCLIERIDEKGRMHPVAEAKVKCHPDDEDRFDDGTPMFDAAEGERLALRLALSRRISYPEIGKSVRAEFWRKFCSRWGLDWDPPREQSQATKTMEEDPFDVPISLPYLPAKTPEELRAECVEKHTQVTGGCDYQDCPNYIPF
jgi:hypothetical protein